jgi:hypothetical protein
MQRRDFVLQPTLALLAGSAAAAVKDFGAVGDGIADDTNAINQGLRSAGSLVLSRGRYRVASEVRVPRGSLLVFLGGELLIGAGAKLVLDGLVWAPSIACMRLAGGVITGSPQNGEIEVDWFGADATGAAPSDEAISTAFALAISPRPPRGARKLRFGPGTYRITRNSILMPAGTTGQPIVGLTIEGAGAESTALVLAPAEKGPHYFFANTRDEIRARAWTFRDIGFEADKNATAVNGFLFGKDYDFCYQRVTVRVPGTVWHGAGTQLGSEHRFSNCFLSGHRVLLLDNLQAVNTQFTATDAWATGPLLDVCNGGLVTWLGGSIALLGNDPSNTFLRIEEKGFPGFSGNARFVSVNIEVYNPNAKLVDCQGAYSQFRGRFEGCKFWPVVAGPQRTMFQFRRGNHVVFRDCTFDAKSLFNIAGAALSIVPPKPPAHALIGFESCTGISRAQISYSGGLTAHDGVARIYSRGSTYELMSSHAAGEVVARDFDLNWRDGAAGAVSAFTAPRKLFHLARTVNPSREVRASSGAMTFSLPEGALVVAIYLRKASGEAGDARMVRLWAIAENAAKPLLESEWRPMSMEFDARAIFDPLSGPTLAGGHQRISCGLERGEGFTVLSGSAKLECVVEYI